MLVKYETYLFNRNIQIALFSFALGLISYSVLRKILKSKYKLPSDVCFTKETRLGKNKQDFLNNLQTDHEHYLTLLQKSYPNECTLNLNSCLSGDKNIIFLNSIESVKKFSQKINNLEPIPDRPKSFLIDFISKGYLGSFFRMYNEKLLEVRKSSLAGLHKLIGSDPNFEEKLTDELKFLIDYFDEEFIDHKQLFEKEEKARYYAINLGKEDGLVLDAPVYFQQISTNIITSLGLGVRFDYEADQNAAIKVQMKNISEALNSLNLLNIINFSKLDSLFSRDTVNFMGQRITSVYDFLAGAFGAYKTSSHDPEFVNTFADFVLAKQKENLQVKKSLVDGDNYSDRDILVQFFTLLMAGTCTTGFTLSWAFYYLSKNPQVQEEIFKEIARNTGTGSFVYTKHKSSLPYTEACLNEILRLSSTQGLIPRSTKTDVQIGDYKIPKDTTVLINMYAIHRDPRFWNTNGGMHPEQWFDENKNLKSYMDSFIPFGLAPRSCIGDNLSRQILFLVIANFVQRFHFEYVPDKNFDYSEKDGNLGVMRRPYNYHLKLSRRN
nr:cytochrome P450 3043A1 [Brachionus rubens]